MSAKMWLGPMVGVFLLAAMGYAEDTIAYSPKGLILSIWEPFEDLTNEPGDKIVARITDDKTQGYTWIRKQDLDQDDNDVEDCTRPNFNVVDNGSGVTFVNAHGAEDHFCGVSVGENYSSVITSWIGDEPEEYMERYHWTVKQIWIAVVWEPWFERPPSTGPDRNWAAEHTAYRTIVVLGVCNAANSLLSHLGGRVRFGYDDSPGSNSTIRDDVDLLFGRMNGHEGSAGLRKAGPAFTAGDFSEHFMMEGNGYTTLCPAPISWWPEGQVAECAGTGGIDFDTHIQSVAAQSALEYEAPDNTIISDRRWTNDYSLRFHYEFTGGNARVKMKAIANYIKAEGGGNQKLDGSCKAPNGDNKEWTFQNY